MFDPIEPLIDATVQRVREGYTREYAGQEPDYPDLLERLGRRALTRISKSDALYHDVHHTSVVTLVGQQILRGKRLSGDPVAPREWLHFVLSLLFHDIGLVGGLCRDDRDEVRATGLDGGTITLPRGATDAYLAPYHVDRAQLYVRERFAGHGIVDPELLAANIERTRFPVPERGDHQLTSDLPGLVRAADLIGHVADPDHHRRLPALFYEFEEVGLNARLGFSNPEDLRSDYPRFFWKAVAPNIQEGLRYLRATPAGERWIANLLSRLPEVKAVEEILARQAGGEPWDESTSSPSLS